MQNHIGQVHACAMALDRRNSHRFCYWNECTQIPDIVLIKSLKVDFKRPSKGAIIAAATLTDEQQKLMQESDRKVKPWSSVIR